MLRAFLRSLFRDVQTCRRSGVFYLPFDSALSPKPFPRRSDVPTFRRSDGFYLTITTRMLQSAMLLSENPQPIPLTNPHLLPNHPFVSSLSLTKKVNVILSTSS